MYQQVYEVTATVSPYLVEEGQPSSVLVIVASAGFVLGAGGLTLGALMQNLWVFFTSLLLLICGGAVGIFGPVYDDQKWNSKVSQELSSHYGVEVSATVLSQQSVRLMVSDTEPHIVPLLSTSSKGELEPTVSRDPETGIFSEATQEVLEESAFYLLVDGKVLEIATRDGNQYIPYSPTKEPDGKLP